ncbi:hypothetical protein OHA21_20575 [Actinoplanes sp. NBC_00393]|uniref:hypothetical protein n=1 Tax=Actinoplanes sp. NBC_00393 TaxID=2975953 RepID=UPI002E1DDED6
MAPRKPDVILDGVLQRKGKGATMRRQLAANKPRNWMLALTLHSFAKFAANGQLTDLERSIVSAYQKNGFSDAEIKEHGKVGERLTDPVRKELFPERYARMRFGKDSYSMSDLRTDAPDLVKSFRAMPNVVDVDVEAIHGGRAVISDFRPPDREVLREHASEGLIALEAAAAPPGRYTIKATRFKCIDRATDSIFGPSNEPYWVFGSTDGDKAKATRSSVFGDVDSGESRNFNSTDGVMWGLNGAAQPLPDGEVGMLVSLWEHDEGDPSKIQAGVAAAFAGAAGILVATGVAAWVGAVVAAVGGVVHWLLGFLDDDHIADQVFTVSGPLIAKQVPNVGGSTDLIRRFTDGDADYELTVKITRTA